MNNNNFIHFSTKKTKGFPLYNGNSFTETKSATESKQKIKVKVK